MWFFDIDVEKPNIIVESWILQELDIGKSNFKNCNDFAIVYFDLKTCGFEKNADILQIAAKFDDHTFLYKTYSRNEAMCF